jgi:hypothetical protein
MKDILDMDGWSLTDKRTEGLVSRLPVAPFVTAAAVVNSRNPTGAFIRSCANVTRWLAPPPSVSEDTVLSGDVNRIRMMQFTLPVSLAVSNIMSGWFTANIGPDATRIDQQT